MINTEFYKQTNKKKIPVRLLITCVLFIIAIYVLYFDTVAHIVGTWNSNEGAHGPLIVVVSLYLIWIKKNDFKTLPRYPVSTWGSLLTASGCFMLFAGKLSSTILLQQISIVPFLLGLILLFLGWSFFRALFLPVIYLIFVTGFIETLLSNIAIYLQLTSAWIAVQLFKLIGMPVLLQGILIDLPHISLIVVRGCSGISHLVAILALSIPLGIISKLTPFRKLILIGSSLIIGLLANGLRITLIGMYSHFNPGVEVHGPNETLAVSVIFFIGMIFLLILNYFLKPRSINTSVKLVENEINMLSADDHYDLKKSHAFYSAFIVAALLIFATYGFINFYNIIPVPLNKELSSLIYNINGYSGKQLTWVDERLRPFTADEELMAAYVDLNGNMINVYIGYFEEQSRERKLIDYRRGWMHEEAKLISVSTSGGSFKINHTRSHDRANPSNIYFWYVIDGRIVYNQYLGKFYTFFDGLFKRRTNGAVVVFETRSSLDEVMPILKEMLPQVQSIIR